ncbi:MAG: winged helix-turn-helix transcriptional regulator [Thermoplasmatota archaeon]
MSEREDALALGSRRRVYEYIRATPGAHLRDIERGTGLGLGVLRHHLDRLLELALVSESADGRLRRFYPREIGPELRAALAGLRQSSHRRILLVLLNRRGATSAEISVELRLPASTTRFYLRQLVARGLVARENQGYELVDAALVVRALVAHRESFLDRFVDAALEVYFESSRT